MPLPTIIGEFRAVADPTLNFTASGKGVASIRLVASKPKQVEEDGEKKWVDDKTFWCTGTMWNSDNGKEAENLCESIKQGDLVEIRGVLYEREYETKEGEKRKSMDVSLYAIAPSLKRATAKVVKAVRSTTSEPATGVSGTTPDDPWLTAPSSDEPPF